jgi:hypothetical protein
MTRDEIVKQMGWPLNANSAISDLVDRVEAVVREAEEAEREACAKLCNGIRYSGYCPPEDGAAPDYYNSAAEECATAIRARGET